MMSTPIASAFTGKRIALTSANSWVGCSAALHLSQGLTKHCEDVQLICLVRNDDNLEVLKQLKNVRVEKVDYDDERTLERALRGVSCVVMFMEMDDQRVQFGKKFVAAMKNQHVDSCLMISIRGTEHSPLPGHQAYREVEQEIERNISNYVILRKSFLMQTFLFWSHIVGERGLLPLPIGEDSLSTNIDLIDLVNVIESVTVEHCQVTSRRPDCKVGTFGKHTNKKYTLAGPEQCHPSGIVQTLNRASGSNVEFKSVSREEIGLYLRALTEHEDWGKVDAGLCEKLLTEQGDRQQYAPSLPMINLLLDELEWGIVDNTLTSDLRELLGREGRTLRDFFLKEKETFKPRGMHRATAKL